MKKHYNKEIQLELSLRSVENKKLVSGTLKKIRILLLSGYPVLTAVD